MIEQDDGREDDERQVLTLLGQRLNNEKTNNGIRLLRRSTVRTTNKNRLTRKAPERKAC